MFFRKRATNYRALLREMTYKDKAFYDSTPPCTKIQNMLYQYTKKICYMPAITHGNVLYHSGNVHFHA